MRKIQKRYNQEYHVSSRVTEQAKTKKYDIYWIITFNWGKVAWNRTVNGWQLYDDIGYSWKESQGQVIGMILISNMKVKEVSRGWVLY